IYANDNFCRISGYSRDELLGQNHRLLKSGMHPPTLFREMYRQIARGRVWRGELCNRAKDGSHYWVDTVITPQLGPDGKPVAYMAIRVDVTARKRVEAQLAHAARHDALTGIANRAALLE
ncbi:PAS domain-containing protein, partial [Klebsiella pneumoniae]|uniref:PAS domain-containing protein n=1 Tax=Klebsiella pneumoniae TaxID=573 RepID=UPI00371F5D73